MKAIFINAIKGIELPEIFKNVQAEYYTEEEMREYMLKRYNVYCGSMKDLEQAINDYIPNEDILEELSEVLA